ncbi:MAG: DUF3783 domain-containing protein [Chordicoccus sp.]
MDKFILLFGFDDEKGREQAAALASKTKILDIGIRVIGPDRYDSPLFSLTDETPDDLSSPGQEENKHIAGSRRNKRRGSLPCRMLILSGIEDADLDFLLPMIGSCGITQDDLKAMLTPTNAVWTPRRLCTELAGEHAAMWKNKR